MKTKEVIRLLNECDPSGEKEVCVGNVDIHFIDMMPAYYDGPLQVLTRDESKQGYNITGGKYFRSGDKIQIHTLSFSDAITNFGTDTKFDVDYSEVKHDEAQYRKNHEDLRQFMRDVEQKCEMDLFSAWFLSVVSTMTVDVEDARQMACDYFTSKKNILPTNPITVKDGQSYRDARHEEWNKRFVVSMKDGFINLSEAMA